MTQREAVFNAVQHIMGETRGQVKPDKTQLKQIHEVVFQLFKSGQVDLRDSDTKPRTDEWLNKYIPGLVNNWLRKDTRLNGGEAYKTKNPGSRTGAGDPTLQAMKALLGITEEPEKRQAIQAEIDKRKAELEKSKQPNVDYSKLPESLRHMIPAA